MSKQRYVQSLSGDVFLNDGTRYHFQCDREDGWNQWGASQSELGVSVDIMDAIEAALQEQSTHK
jgi:hypothetical protein